jgi:hypothetical protein
MEDTEASRAAKDLFRECVHPTIVVAMGVQLLQINRADAVAVRQLLMEAGIFSIR